MIPTEAIEIWKAIARSLFVGHCCPICLTIAFLPSELRMSQPHRYLCASGRVPFPKAPVGHSTSRLVRPAEHALPPRSFTSAHLELCIATLVARLAIVCM